MLPYGIGYLPRSCRGIADIALEKRVVIDGFNTLHLTFKDGVESGRLSTFPFYDP